MLDAPPSLDPRTGFGRHTAPGEEFDVVTSAGRLPRAAFRPADPDLAGYVVLDFNSFDWLEDDEEIIGHPRDPFHRVDIRASSLTVEVGLDGVVLAATNGWTSPWTASCRNGRSRRGPRRREACADGPH